VARLEYQAYTKVALKTIADIVRDAASSITRSEHQPPSQRSATYVTSLVHCAVHHRIGVVPVGEPSIGELDCQPMKSARLMGVSQSSPSPLLIARNPF